MSSYVESLIGKEIQVITIEGRVFVGELVSFDQTMNTLMKNSIEKIYSQGSKNIKYEKMGLYLIRGDNIGIISPIEDITEKELIRGS